MITVIRASSVEELKKKVEKNRGKGYYPKGDVYFLKDGSVEQEMRAYRERKRLAPALIQQKLGEQYYIYNELFESREEAQKWADHTGVVLVRWPAREGEFYEV